MKCWQCREAGVESEVKAHTPPEKTLGQSMPFYDKNGHYHNHDESYVRGTYECTNGHTWILDEYNECWCGWEGGE
jgi:hypothetical protein